MEAPVDDYGEYTAWEALPRQLLDWIQTQGLKIHGKPISSREMLELASQLLHRKTTHDFSDTRTSPIVNLAVQVELRYIKEVTRKGSKLTVSSTIPGSLYQIVQRQYFTCKKPVLDDAFPQFHKDMPGTYIIVVMKDPTMVDRIVRGRMRLSPLSILVRNTRVSETERLRSLSKP
jgi:hypothetical protein